MIQFSIEVQKSLLRLEPEERLSASDFEQVSKEVDLFIKEHGPLKKVMIVAPTFPGWEDFDALFEHLHFVKAHHKNIEKVALVTADSLLKLGASQIGLRRFLHPDLKAFETEGEAEKWLFEE